MMMLEFVLMKSPSEWTDEEWEHVRQALKNGELTIDCLKGLNLPVKPLVPFQGVQPFLEQTWAKPFDFDAINFKRPCSVIEFFRQHPEARTASIHCDCPNCATYCASG